MTLREIKTLEDFGPTKRSTGLHKTTMETIRSYVERVKEHSDDWVKKEGDKSEEVISEAQHSIDTCDVVLGKLDKMEGK